MPLERARALKERLARGESACGIWLTIPSPVVAEIVADTGLDWIVYDAEHFPTNPETLLAILLAFRGSPTVPLIRLPWNDSVLIKQALDQGWEGVVLPQVNTPEEAASAGRACRYPPMGERGFGPRRASGYFRSMREYAERANADIICAVQVEDWRAAECIEGILDAPGVDWLLLGPTDMSASLGRLLQMNDPELEACLGRIYSAAAARGVPSGSPWNDPSRRAASEALGCRLHFLGDDTSLLRDGLDAALATWRRG